MAGLKFHEFVNIYPLAVDRKAVEEWAKSRPKPAFICGKEIGDDDVNLLSFGNYIALASAGNDRALIAVMQEIFHLNLYDEDAGVALGFIQWMVQTLEKIAKLFAKAQIPPTDEEKQAGVDRLKFGFFGIVDWYARRMGINHDEAEGTAWIRIYKCLDMETKTALFERRLMRVRMNKQKAQSKSKKRR